MKTEAVFPRAEVLIFRRENRQKTIIIFKTVVFKSNFEYDGFYIKLQNSSIIIDSIRSYADI